MEIKKKIYPPKLLKELEKLDLGVRCTFIVDENTIKVFGCPKDKENTIKTIIQNHNAEKAEQEYLAQEEDDNKLLSREAAILRALLEKAINGTKIPDEIRELIKK